MNIPSFQSFEQMGAKDRLIWYNVFQDMVDTMPLVGTVSPENNVAANKSCLYVQTSGGTASLWFNESGNGSKTGWVAK